MTQNPITVTYDIKELFTNLERNINARFEKIDQRFEKMDQRLEKLEEKIDKVEEKVTTLEIGQAKMTEKIESIDTRLIKVENSLTRQIWALIIVVIAAVLGLLAKLLNWLPSNP